MCRGHVGCRNAYNGRDSATVVPAICMCFRLCALLVCLAARLTTYISPADPPAFCLCCLLQPGYMLGRAAIPKYAIVTSLDGVPTPDLRTFALVLRTLQHGARVPLEYFTFGERHRRKSAILQVCCAGLLSQQCCAAGRWQIL